MSRYHNKNIKLSIAAVFLTKFPNLKMFLSLQINLEATITFVVYINFMRLPNGVGSWVRGWRKHRRYVCSFELREKFLGKETASRDDMMT